jgi:hypothetical protein
MNWFERARREISNGARRPTANSAERNLTAAMAVPLKALRQKLEGSIGRNGSAPPSKTLKSDIAQEGFEERAAIMDIDGGLSRDAAE